MVDLADLVDLARAGDLPAERELLTRAGAGCIEAQRAIRDGLLADLRVVDALVLCRLIAARGTVEDRHRLAASLFVLAKEHQANGDPCAAADSATEALGMFRDLVDEGDGRSLQALAAMGPQFPEVMAALDRSGRLPDGLADKLAAGSDVTAIPPPIITTFAPWPAAPASAAARLAERWDNFVWSVRFWWWGFSNRFKRGY
jgi:hypothetical protein